MYYKHENIGKYIDTIEPGSVFVEIGSDRFEGSTLYLADLADRHNTTLLSVDIDPSIRYRTNNMLTTHKECWNEFYNNVKDPSWPHAESIDDLSEEIRQECINVFHWDTISKNFIPPEFTDVAPAHISQYTLATHPAISWYTNDGAKWAHNYANFDRRAISLLYLDNVDWQYFSDNNIQDSNLTYQSLKQMYQDNYGVDLNNQYSQLEHFKQALYLVPFLTPDAIVALDDTFLFNGCWVGKCGPVVVYLLSLGFVIQESQKGFLLLRKQ